AAFVLLGEVALVDAVAQAPVAVVVAREADVALAADAELEQLEVEAPRLTVAQATQDRGDVVRARQERAEAARLLAEPAGRGSFGVAQVIEVVLRRRQVRERDARDQVGEEAGARRGYEHGGVSVPHADRAPPSRGLSAEAR